MFRLAVDIGGTFTDAVLMDEEGHHPVLLSKIPSTPHDYSEGVVNSILRLKSSMDNIESFIHGTTVGTNAIIQGTFKDAALLTTRGFRDVLEIGRGNRVNMYDPFYRMPEPMIPRDRRIEIGGRVNSRGIETEKLDVDDLKYKVRSLIENGVKALAICLINSYANSSHEEEAKRIIEENFPSVQVSISTEITKEYNEYERTSTVVLNALLLHIMNRYLVDLEEKIAFLRFPGKLMLIQSNGGLMTSFLARKIPVHTINSGLVGGILAVRTLGRILGLDDLIGADMGGTSFDVELVIGKNYETTPMMRIKTPSSGPDGYPILIPAVDIHAIGTGGGSIAWIDATSALHVGPMSAAASPGPAAYGRGGTEPTVTDANLVLGRLEASNFLGGEMRVNPEFAKTAVKKISDYYSMDLLEAAEGIIKIAAPSMASAIRTMTVERGIDPRDFVMVSFGGAGPLHANLIARELQINRVIVSTMPGNFSAWGMLTADFRRDYVQTFIMNLEKLDLNDLEGRFSKIESEARKTMTDEGISESNMLFVREVDIRYLGQGHALTISLSTTALQDNDYVEEIDRRFDELHLQRFMHNAPKQAKEIVALRVASIGRTKPSSLSTIKTGSVDPAQDAMKPSRDVYIDGSLKSCKIYDRDRLLANNRIFGPAVIEERVSTTLLLERYVAKVDSYGHLLITPE